MKTNKGPISRKLALALVSAILFSLAIDAQTQAFTYTGDVQEFVVPCGINVITISATGADGSDDRGTNVYLGPHRGGSGGIVKASFPVMPGDHLLVIVGGTGAENPQGYRYSGGGGGGTAVINCGNPANCATGKLLVVAGGGGGAITDPTYFFSP